MAERTIEIEPTITVGDLAKKLEQPAVAIIRELMKNGVMATVNEQIDFDTAVIVVGEIDPEAELKQATPAESLRRSDRELSKHAQDRPPVVAVMGHVDHGKTSLLDAIREADEAKHEAGGITQHISAYQIEHSGRKITFLDTPGHEAFAALREHGAKLTDVAIIVVAADDGIKPQTKEAIRYAQQAGVKIVVAINKIDKEGADVNRVKQQLAEENLMTEEWGGEVVTVEVSAKTKLNLDKLLDMVLLVADVEELKAELDVPAEGLIIESHMETGKGPVAEALVEHGVLKPGTFVVAGSTYAKIRILTDPNGQPIKEATPSTPVIITGFKDLPEFGDLFVVANDEKTARSLAGSVKQSTNRSAVKVASTGGELIAKIDRESNVNDYNVILRADVQGSLKSVSDSLQTLDREEVVVKIISAGVGHVTENDVTLAETSGAVIYGFNTSVPVNVKRLAATKQVPIRIFKVIYELIDDVKTAMEGLLSPEIVEKELGKLTIKGVFMTSKEAIICGGEVTSGKALPNVLVRIERGKELLGEAQVTSVQRQQQEAKEILEGELCGLQLKTERKLQLEIGDKLTFLTRESVARKL